MAGKRRANNPATLSGRKAGDSFRPMSAEKTVTFYLHPQLRRQAERGQHNFIKKVGEVLGDAGLNVAFDGDDTLARLRAMARPGRGLFLMEPPPNDRCLTFRRTYVFPFWHIEKVAERWEWPVAKEQFVAASQDAAKAANFYRFWQKRLFDGATKEVRSDGFVYVPLQGRLTSHRSFQYCSPIDMIRAVLKHDPAREVIATLHPTEVYDSDEKAALEDLLSRHDRLYVREAGSERYLKNCDYIVTQNSSVGFLGYFFGKPLILFGKADFHHIALNVSQIGLTEAFEAVEGHAPDHAGYLHWFLQKRAINAGRPEAKQSIRAALQINGWQV
jgi:hypothetical protein